MCADNGQNKGLKVPEKNVKVSKPLHGKMCIAVALYKSRYVNIKTFLEIAITHELEAIKLEVGNNDN